ncbi:MAG: hypothetical protein QOG72_3148 [Sphingomonadales bacterium]|jgi:hypothetical protein|nr:hypothetical protein [Sphingomonadales bacterium]
MILLAALAVAAAQEASPPPAEEDIVIVGQRIRKLRYSIKPDRKTGIGVCRVKRSSGDPEIDALACEAGRACMGATRKDAFLACLTPRFEKIPATIAARRRMRNESGNHAPN